MKINNYMIVGASHVEGWRMLRDARVLPNLSITSDLIFGIVALPLFSLKMKNFVGLNSKDIDRIILFVSDFRYGNSHFFRAKMPQTPFVADEFDPVFKSTQRGFSPPARELISMDNDTILYQNGMVVLDDYLNTFGDKIRFVFWDLNVREARNIESGKYLQNGVYRHPLWNYDELFYKYENNSLDVSVIRKEIDEFVFDQQGHPSFKGYVFLWNLLKTSDPNISYLIAQREVPSAQDKLFSLDVI